VSTDARDYFNAVPIIASTDPEPPESDDDDDELTPAALLECIMADTDMHIVDYLGDAREVLLSNPRFLVLRQTSHTSLVLFPDGVHGIFLKEDVHAAHSKATTPPTLTPRQLWTIYDR
jgi:hypothetical protein